MGKIYRWWNAHLPVICWNTHLPVMLAMVYLQLLKAETSARSANALLSVFLYLIATVGIAHLGYLLNDLFDREEDLQSRSPDKVVLKGRKRLLLTFVPVSLMAALPWSALPLTPAILTLLIIELCLFIAYSVPPLRLKNRGLFGPIVYGLSAYTVPCLVSLLTFGKLSGWFSVVLAIWSLLVGIHSRLIHQLSNASRDLLAKTSTFVTRHGWLSTVEGMERYLLPAELGAFTLLVLLIGLHVPLVPIGFLLYMLWMVYRWQTFGLWQTGDPRQLPLVERLFFSHLIVLLRFYTDWLPILLLIALVWHTPIYAILFLAHLLLFQNGIVTLFRFEIPEMRRLGRII